MVDYAEQLAGQVKDLKETPGECILAHACLRHPDGEEDESAGKVYSSLFLVPTLRSLSSSVLVPLHLSYRSISFMSQISPPSEPPLWKPTTPSNSPLPPS